MQIKSTAKPQGLFNYEFDKSDLVRPYQRVVDIEEVSCFIDLIFDTLWERTENNLQAVRNAVHNNLKHKLFEALQDCESKMIGIVPSGVLAPFRSAVTRCRTQLAYTIEAIADWFRIDLSQQMPDFPLPALVDSLLGVVARCSGPARLQVCREIAGNENVPGKLFRGLWDLMFILLDNAAKHSKVATVHVRLALRFEEGVLSVTVQNNLGEEVDRDALKAVIRNVGVSDINEAVARSVRREGGTGLLKLHKIISADLGAKGKYTIEPMLTDCGEFRVSIAVEGIST